MCTPFIEIKNLMIKWILFWKKKLKFLFSAFFHFVGDLEELNEKDYQASSQGKPELSVVLSQVNRLVDTHITGYERAIS